MTRSAERYALSMAMWLVAWCGMLSLPALAIDPPGPNAPKPGRPANPPDKLAQIIALATDAIQKDPTQPNPFLARAAALLEQKKLEFALSDVDQALKLDPKQAKAYLLRAAIFNQQKKLDESLADLDRAIALDPNQPSAYMVRGGLHANRKNFDLAIEDFNRASQLQPENPGIRVLRAACFRAQRRNELAIEELSAVLKDHPNYVPALQGRGMCLIESDRPAAAIDDFSRVVELDRGNVSALLQRSHAYGLCGERQREQDDLLLALDRAPREPRVLNNVAWNLATSPDPNLRNGRQAVKLATLCCQIQENKDAASLDTLAASHAESGDFEKAIEVEQQAMQLSDEKNRAQYAERLQLYQRRESYHQPADNREDDAEREEGAA